jgi:hypothetical protein
MGHEVRVGLANRPFCLLGRELFTELATAAGAGDPPLLASQLQLLYDGGSTAANLDRDPSIAGPARAAAAALIAASIDR